MIAFTRRGAASGLAASAAVRPGPKPGQKPGRIVSLNPCVDAILVKVADRGRIAAISHYSHDPASSSLGPEARTYPITYGSAEEILALRPDLVLSTRYAPAATRAALAKLNIETELFDVPESVEASEAQVRRIAGLVGHPERGEALVQRIEAALAAAAPRPGERRLSALVFEAGGFASARGTLTDELMRRCGFDNAAPRYGLKRTGNVPLERLIADPPQVLLAGEAQPGAPTWADRVIRHPALASVAHRMHRASFPQRLTHCGGPVIIEAAAMLARARREAAARLT